MIQCRASWKRLMPQEWIREGLWVIPECCTCARGRNHKAKNYMLSPSGCRKRDWVRNGPAAVGLCSRGCWGCKSQLRGCPEPVDLQLCPVEQLLAHDLREPDLRDKRMVAEVVLYRIPLSGAYFTGSNGAWLCWPFFGRGPEGFTVHSRRREGDAPWLGLSPVWGRRGQAFVRGGQINLDR